MMLLSMVGSLCGIIGVFLMAKGEISSAFLACILGVLWLILARVTEIKGKLRG